MDRRCFLRTSLGAVLVVPLGVEALRRGLRELGWIEGQNIVIEYRLPDGKVDPLSGLADELVRLKVDVIAAGPTPPAMAARNHVRSTSSAAPSRRCRNSVRRPCSSWRTPSSCNIAPAWRTSKPSIALHGLVPNVEAGGLMSYGPDIAAVRRRAAFFVNRILKGTKPTELPVERPTKFDLVVNLKTAKALGLTIPSRCYCGRTR